MKRLGVNATQLENHQPRWYYYPISLFLIFQLTFIKTASAVDNIFKPLTIAERRHNEE
jgi:hypothetical protein